MREAAKREHCRLQTKPAAAERERGREKGGWGGIHREKYLYISIGYYY